MHLVYKTAERVIIWLGAGSSEIDHLFDWMTALDQQVLAAARPNTLITWENQWGLVVSHQGRKPPPDGIREALSELLRRQWFSRIWVLQEAALAKSAMVTCGWKEVNSRVFVVMPSLLNIECGESEQARLDILPGLLRKQSWWASNLSRDLLTLLQKFGRSNASDRRDIIYALLGLSQDTHSSEFLQPNYEITVEEAIQRSVAYFMLKTRDLSQQTPVQYLPRWSIDTFLDCLHDLPLGVFQWATDEAQDALMYDLIICQRENHWHADGAQRIQRYMRCTGRYGPPITIAIKKENSSLIDLLLQTPGADISKVDSDGRDPLSTAVAQGNKIAANLILAHRQLYIQQTKPLLNPVLRVAVEQGFSDLVGFLRKQPEMAPFEENIDVVSAPPTEAMRGDLAMVRSILWQTEHRTSVVDSGGDGPLNIAARRGDKHVVELLLQRLDERDVRFRGSDGLTPFRSAIVGGYLGAAQKILLHHQRAVRDDVKDAARTNQVELLRKILDWEPDLADRAYFPLLTPLRCAAEAGNTSVVSLLLDKGAEINPRDFDDRAATPLWIAASRGHLDTVKLLVERGANTELMATESPFTKTTPLWAAASQDHIDIVMYLMEAGANFKAAEDDQSQHVIKNLPGSATVLRAAILMGQTKTVSPSELLQKNGGIFSLPADGIAINPSSPRWPAQSFE